MLQESFKYLRFGTCKRCGFCCSAKNCKHFKWVDDIAVCEVYTHMPEKCKEYPKAPPILTEDCGYRFVDKLHRRKLNAKES